MTSETLEIVSSDTPDARSQSIIDHVLAHSMSLPMRRPARERDPSRDEITISTTANPQDFAWLSAADEGFHGHRLRVHVPANAALNLQIYHCLTGPGPARQYTGHADDPVFCHTLWMFGREIGYLVTWNELDRRETATLTIVNPNRPGQPLVIELVQKPQAETVAVAASEKNGSKLSIERYS